MTTLCATRDCTNAPVPGRNFCATCRTRKHRDSSGDAYQQARAGREALRRLDALVARRVSR